MENLISRRILLLLFVMIATTFVVGSAFAFELNVPGYEGQVKIKFSNWEISDPAFDGNGNGFVDNVGEKLLGIAKITNIVALNSANTSLWVDGVGGEELTVMFNNFEAAQVTVSPNSGGFKIFFVDGDLNVYLDAAKNFQVTYPGSGVVDGSLFLSMKAVTGVITSDAPDSTYNETITTFYSTTNNLTTPLTGKASGYLEVTGGSHASLFGGVGARLFMESDLSTPTATRPGFGWPIVSEDPIVGFIGGRPCIDLEKEVSVDGLDLMDPSKVWFDADLLSGAPPTDMSASYRLIVENCGNVPLTGVTLADIMPSTTFPETIVFTDVQIPDLQPGDRKVLVAGYIADLALDGSYSNSTSISGFAGLDAPGRCLDNRDSGEGTPDGTYLNTAKVTTNEGVFDDDPAWVSCRLQEVGACRMTGGSVTINQFIDMNSDPVPFYSYDAETYADATTIVKGNNSKNSTGTWVTTGGQIGAPSTDPATGHWTHTQHAGKEGNFTFLAGTASAPSGTEISNIDCADPGWCVQARCAPFKQIFWDGIGYFANKHGGVDFNASFPDTACSVIPGGPRGDLTKHYFRAMVGDFGENDRRNRQPDNTTCDWVPGGFDVSEVSLLEAVTDPQFGDKGGQTCDKCADYYKIEIYCGEVYEPGNVIYTFTDFIDGGNFQIHPETSEQCTVDLFVPVATGATGKNK